MTAAERTALDDLLTAHRGDFALAAKARNEAEKDLRALVAADHYLNVRWIEAMRVVDPIDRPSLALDEPTRQSPLTPADQRLLEGVEGQDRKLATLGWAGFGMKPKDVDLMRTFEAFVGKAIMRTLDATHGGMLYGFGRIASRFREICDAMEGVDPTSDQGEILHGQMTKLAELLIKFNADASRAAHLRAMIEKMVIDESKKTRTNKPGSWHKPKKANGAEAA